ncbi:MAG: hypothetical protein JWN46_944 [Acidimicrobiales bacterium]|nr:hypothetical protein [Acidimicrobiales bacterium]
MALHGDLETFPLPDVLRLLASTSKSGRLDVTGADGHGEVWFVDGGLTGGRVSTALNAIEPAEVVYELQRFANGAFEFDATAPVDGDESRVAVDAVLEDAAAMLRVWHEVTAVVPSVDCWVSLVPELDHEVTIGADQWRTVAGLRGGMSVRGLAERFRLTELSACQAVKDLVDRGLAAVGEELPRTAAEPAFVPTVAADEDAAPAAGPTTEAEDDPAAADADAAPAAAADDLAAVAPVADLAPAPDELVAADHDHEHATGHDHGHDHDHEHAVEAAVDSAVGAAIHAAFEPGAPEADLPVAAPMANELPGDAGPRHVADASVSARDRLDAMAATYLAAGAGGAVVLGSDDHALLPEPLPGAGTSFESNYDEPEEIGEIHAFGRHEIDHHRPAPLAPSAAAGGAGTILPPASVPAYPHLAAAGPADHEDQSPVPDAGFGWRPERRAKRPDAVQSALANLSPAAAQAIAEVADKSGQGVRPGTADADGDAVDRGTLLRFLSSVKN